MTALKDAKHGWKWCVALLGAAGLVGCGQGGPQIVPVSGQVLIDGQPLGNGSVAFAPANWRASGGKLDSEGRFQLAIQERGRIVEGAALGHHRLAVSGAESLSESQIKWHAPPKYADFTTSGLSFDVVGPIDNAVINLTWAGGKPFTEVIEGTTAEKEYPHTANR
jgi:hypothetical protein